MVDEIKQIEKFMRDQRKLEARRQALLMPPGLEIWQPLEPQYDAAMVKYEGEKWKTS